MGGGAQGAVDEVEDAPVEITLEQYAGITAALADDLPLEAILDNEGLDPPAWKPVDTLWKSRLAEAGPTGPLFQSFLGKRSEAEDHLARRVRPIDDDLAAWTSFLKTFGAHPSPGDLLTTQGLGLSDLSRLQRRWSRRLAADQELARKAAELAAKSPAPLPPLSVEPLVLKRFPWSPGPRVRAPEPVDRPGEGASAALADLPLDRYAALRAELAEPAADPALLAPRYGLPAARFAQLDAQWKQLLAADLSLQRDYERLFEHQRARLRRPASGAIAAPRIEVPVIEVPWIEAPPVPRVVQPAPNRLAGTALALDLPRGPALPFVAGEAPEEIRSASHDEAVAPRPPGIGGTALAVDVPRGPALPFAGQKEPANPRPALAGTALAVDVPRAPELPFVEGEAPAEVRASSLAEAAAPRPVGLGGTSLAVEVPRAPELPFAPDPAASAKAKKLGVRMFELPAHLRTAAAKPVPPAPPAAPAPPAPPPPPAIPALSIEQYASLHVELSLAPGRAAEILGRYRLSEAQRAALEAHFQGRFQREAGLRASFEQACVTYRGWLRSQGRG